MRAACLRTISMLGLMTGLVGCVDDNVGVYIAGNIAGEGDMGVCMFDPESGNYLVRGVWDVGVGAPYTITPEIRNQLLFRGTTTAADPNHVFINRAQVELIGPDGNTIAFPDPVANPNPFSVRMSAFVESSSDPSTPSGSAASLDAIPASYAASLAGLVGPGQTVTVSVKLFGRTGGDIDIETGEWFWPVEICTNCLVSCNAAESAAEELPCAIGQDRTASITPDSSLCGLCAGVPGFDTCL